MASFADSKPEVPPLPADDDGPTVEADEVITEEQVNL